MKYFPEWLQGLILGLCIAAVSFQFYIKDWDSFLTGVCYMLGTGIIVNLITRKM